jgi:ferredoxin-NADP reductase/MOSC domain-containing protein YiiM
VLVSVNVGMPKDVPWQGKTVHTGIWKYPVHGPAMARRLNIDGDGQGDLAGHGGEQRAVLVYQLDSYRVGLRLGQPQLPALLVSHHRPGFYMRVITEGHIQAGDAIVKTRTGSGALSVADTDALLYLPGRDPRKLRAALRIPALSPGWQRSFRDLLAAAEGNGTVGAPAQGVEPAWPAFRELRVAEVVRESATVSSIYFAAADGTALPAARAGQYLTLRITGAGQPTAVRSYSLSSALDAGTYRISVKQEPHGIASSYLNHDLEPGAVLDVAAPRGDFVLDDGTGPVLLISAGIGVTPVLAMLHQLAARHSERDIWWLYGARGPHEHPFAAEAHALLASLPHAREHVFYSAATPAERHRVHAACGRLNKQALASRGVPADASAYICGPTSFMADMRDALTALGVAPAAIHTELFGALPSINPGLTGQARRAPHQPPGSQRTGPLVTFARSGISTPFASEWRSVLDLADACDVPTRWSCRTGVCHTCVTPLLSGDITYNPAPLEPPAGGEVLICCARPGTDIVLDM